MADQIVPARYLKVTDKEGLADALFRDYRFNEDGTKKDPVFILGQSMGLVIYIRNLWLIHAEQHHSPANAGN